MITRRTVVTRGAALMTCVAGLAWPAAGQDAFTPPRNSWVTTKGGAGGQIVKVTTLAAEGPGSLKEALDQNFPRTIVFEVGGDIDLAGAGIKVRSPYLTIAGQTAPAPGVTIIRGKISLSTHDIIVQHLSFRPGTAGNKPGSGWEADGLTLYGAHDVVIDHCSFSWATDENLSVSGTRFDGRAGLGKAVGAPYNVVVSNCIIAEALMNATHRKGGHSKGLLIHDNAENVLVVGNLFISNHDRNALFKGGARGAFINNAIINPGVTAVSYNLSLKEWSGQPVRTGRLSVIGNAYRPGPDTRKNLPFMRILGEGAVDLYMRDNAQVTSNGRFEPLDSAAVEPSGLRHDLSAPFIPDGISILPVAQAWTQAFETAGARPWDRDVVDQKILERARNGTTRIIDNESQVGGYAVHKPKKQSFKAAEWIAPDMRPRQGQK